MEIQFSLWDAQQFCATAQLPIDRKLILYWAIKLIISNWLQPYTSCFLSRMGNLELLRKMCCNSNNIIKDDVIKPNYIHSSSSLKRLTHEILRIGEYFCYDLSIAGVFLSFYHCNCLCRYIGKVGISVSFTRFFKKANKCISQNVSLWLQENSLVSYLMTKVILCISTHDSKKVWGKK